MKKNLSLFLFLFVCVTMSNEESAQVVSKTYKGSCQCGNVEFEITGGPWAWRCFCHCNLCRKSTGAPFVAVIAVKQTETNFKLIKAGETFKYSTSEPVNRVYCAKCGALSYIEATFGGQQFVDVTLATLEGAVKDNKYIDELAPKVHIFYANRVMDVNDDLPKFDAFPPTPSS
jgi:hypothetical protein